MPSKRVLSPDDPKNQPYKDSKFKIWEVERHARLAPIRERLNKLYGEGVWGMDEALQDLEHSREIKAQSHLERKKERRRTVKSRVDAYLQVFKDPTPNDYQSIAAMSNIEEQMESIEDELATSKDLKVDDRKKLGELYAKLSTEHRQLQTALGILRADRESEMDTAAEIKRFIHGAKQKIADEGIVIACPHCSEKMALNQGFVLFHFKANVKWKWESQCPNPKCKKMFVLKSENFDVPEGVEPVKELAPVPF